MIGVKINENVIIEKVSRSDNKQSLEIVFSEVKEKELSFFEMAQSSEMQDTTSGQTTIRVWSVKVPTYKAKEGALQRELTDKEKLNRINGDIGNRKNQLIHILRSYLPNDQIHFDLHEGTGVNGANWEEMWLNDNVLLEMFGNMCTQFITQIGPFVGNKELKMRLKLIRQSTDKPYPTLPDMKFLEAFPFFEDMKIPKEASKIKFSPYEIKEGLSNDEVPDKAAADKTPEATPETQAEVFGAR